MRITYDTRADAIAFGPEGGDEGGRIVATGTPEKVAQVAGELHGAVLAEGAGGAEGREWRVQEREGKEEEGSWRGIMAILDRGYPNVGDSHREDT